MVTTFSWGANRSQEWRDEEGELHSEDDHPARIKGQELQWWKHGLLHRDNGKPAILNTSSNRKEYYVDGKRHRIDGPAFVCDAIEAYYVNDVLLYDEKIEPYGYTEDDLKDNKTLETLAIYLSIKYCR